MAEGIGGGEEGQDAGIGGVGKTRLARELMIQAGLDGAVELSEISYTESTPKGDVPVKGMIVRSPRFSAIPCRTSARSSGRGSTSSHQRKIPHAAAPATIAATSRMSAFRCKPTKST